VDLLARMVLPAALLLPLRLQQAATVVVIRTLR